MRCHGCRRRRPFTIAQGYEPGWQLRDHLTHWFCPECLNPSQLELGVGA